MPSEGGRPETVVVGAGLIGLAVAFELLRSGRAVTVLDRGQPGHGATFAAGGILAPVPAAETDETETISFGSESLARYPEFVAGVERIARSTVDYRSEGSLWIAVNRDDREDMERLEQVLRSKSLEVERLTTHRLLELEPHLSGRVLGGLWVEQDRHVDPRQLAQALRQAIEALGGRVFEGMTVDRVEERGGRVHAVGGTRADGVPFSWGGSEVVLAAGAWCFDTIDVPLTNPGLRPVKGQLVRLRGMKLLDHVVRTPDVCLIPRSDGELLIGATVEELGFDESPSAGAVMDLLRHAWEILPAIYDLELSEVSVGLRSALEGHRPVIGATSIGGLFLALGHFRNGILLAPATAHHLSRWIVDGNPPGELEPFSPGRLMSDEAPPVVR